MFYAKIFSDHVCLSYNLVLACTHTPQIHDLVILMVANIDMFRNNSLIINF